jgi:NACalpha-BTF3-like transcription factor
MLHNVSSCHLFPHRAAHSNASKANRAEKKSRKAIQKLGMKSVPGVTRITIKKSKNVCFHCTLV